MESTQPYTNGAIPAIVPSYSGIYAFICYVGVCSCNAACIVPGRVINCSWNTSAPLQIFYVSATACSLAAFKWRTRRRSYLIARINCSTHLWRHYGLVVVIVVVTAFYLQNTLSSSWLSWLILSLLFVILVLMLSVDLSASSVILSAVANIVMCSTYSVCN